MSFGTLIRGLPPGEVLNLELKHPPAKDFRAQDTLASGLVLRSLAGERVASIDLDRPFDHLRLLELSAADRRLIGDTFPLPRQQARGAWFLPDQAYIHVGEANIPYHFRCLRRFASGVAHDETGKVNLAAAPEALFFWAVLDPLFALLYRPLVLRGPAPLAHGPSPPARAAEQRKAWAEIDDSYAALGVDVGDSLANLRYGGQWSKLSSPEKLQAKETFLASLQKTVGADIGGRFRIFAIQALVEGYYEKARRGAPVMRQVLTKPLQQTLSGYFAGDWLAFLRYIEERPSPDEQISIALPEPKLYVDAASKAAMVATKQAIPLKEIERILSTFWGGSGTESPVHQRIAVLREFWSHFDALHARQAPGMRPLWGLIEGSDGTKLLDVDHVKYGPEWYYPGQHANLLPADLLGRVKRLWEGLFFLSAPERIVSAISPYAGMVEAFGPALRLWQGVALTAWFVSEGPYSRTDVGGLADYHKRDVLELAGLGCPVDPQLFEDLIAAEKKLGPPQPYTDPGHAHKSSVQGITISFTVTVGSRRSGFERLRDVVSEHRRRWMTQSLEPYLRSLWESEIRGAALGYNRLLETKRKSPTARQFARYAEAPTNHWFNGDVSLLYTSFGEKSPVAPIRVRLLPEDHRAFALRVFHALGGTTDQAAVKADWDRHCKRKDLAERSFQYVRLREGFGRRPTMKEFGSWAFEYLAPPLGLSWDGYADTVDACIDACIGSREPP